jgi:hypothetical protein
VKFKVLPFSVKIQGLALIGCVCHLRNLKEDKQAQPLQELSIRHGNKANQSSIPFA